MQKLFLSEMTDSYIMYYIYNKLRIFPLFYIFKSI